MNNRLQQTISAEIPSADKDVTAMIILLGELESLVSEENRLLRKGLPAQISDSTERKGLLASELEDWMGAVQTQKIAIVDATPALRVELTKRGTRLEVVMAENTIRLKGAIAAARRRVEAVMGAIREQGESPAGYGVNGNLHKIYDLNGTGSRVV